MQALDKFGKFFVDNARNKPLGWLRVALFEKNSPVCPHVCHEEIAKLTEEQRILVYRIVAESLTQSMFDLMCAFNESHDFGHGFEVTIDGKPAAEFSEEGLHGEIYDWIEEYSKHPEPQEKTFSSQPAEPRDELRAELLKKPHKD